MNSFALKPYIWKIMVDEKEKVLVVEERDGEAHEVNFSAIDLKGKKLKWSGLKLEGEQWWMGLEAAKNGKVILHKFKESDSPEHIGLYVFNAENGKMLWSNEKLSFWGYLESGIAAIDPAEEERTYFILDENTGAEKSRLSDAEMMKNINKIMREKKNTKIINALHFNQEHEYFKKVSEYILSLTNRQAAGAIDYLEHKKFIIISYYIYSNNIFQNYLLVVDEDGKEYVHELLDTNLKAVGMDTFFVFEDQLVFIKNKK